MLTIGTAAIAPCRPDPETACFYPSIPIPTMTCCLNQAAFDILQAEIRRRAARRPIDQVQQDIALRRLERLRTRPGEPLNELQLRETLADLFPDFDRQVLKRAAQANRGQSSQGWSLWWLLPWGTAAIAALAGGIWVLNLPYPMIRQPVARTMPLVLLPSFMSMDHNYRQAIALTEQADQLVNKATSAADFELGDTKVKAAQKHLDALPVWFLGYYPTAYCGWFGCSWRFTLDEFQQARKAVARMDAKLFQERNALTALADAEAAIAQAKQQYTQGDAAAKEAALTQWQTAMDTIKTIAGETLGGRTAQTKLVAFERDFEEVVGYAADNSRLGNILQAAQLAAETAQKFSPNQPQSVSAWEKAVQLWKDAIAPLDKVKDTDEDYLAARKYVEQYKTKLTEVENRLDQERTSVQAFEKAQQMTTRLFASVPDGATAITPQQTGQIQAIANELKNVKPGTTVYQEAQVLLKSAQKRLQ